MGCFELEKDILDKGMSDNAYIIAQCTNKLLVDKLANIDINSGSGDIAGMERYGLDIRVFDADREIRYFRSAINNDFTRRFISDTAESAGAEDPGCGVAYEDYFDQYMYLDIDTKRSAGLNSEGLVMATGGGIYRLPISDIDDAQIHIRNYINYEPDTGRAYFVDFRCVGFEKEGQANGRI